MESYLCRFWHGDRKIEAHPFDCLRVTIIVVFSWRYDQQTGLSSMHFSNKVANRFFSRGNKRIVRERHIS